MMADLKDEVPQIRNRVQPMFILQIGLAAVGFSILVLIHFTIFSWQAQGLIFSDLTFHLAAIDTLSRNHVPHPLFHYTVMVFSYLFPGGYKGVAPVILVIFELLAGLLIYVAVRYRLKKHYKWPVILSIVAVTFLSAAIYLPLFSETIYLGQGGILVLHNPTLIFLKPFAFLAFLSFWWLTRPDMQKRHIIQFSVITSMICILSMLAKPNFGLAFVLSAPLYMLILYLFWGRKDLLNAWFFLPSVSIVLVLFLQFLYTYGGPDPSKIVVDWFLVAGHRSSNPLFSFALLSGFPLAAVSLYPRILRNKLLVLVLLTFLVSTLQYFALAESGPRLWDENFSWGRMTVIPLLFALCLSEILIIAKKVTERVDILKMSVLFALVAGHLASGLIYTHQLLTANSYA